MKPHQEVDDDRTPNEEKLGLETDSNYGTTVLSFSDIRHLYCFLHHESLVLFSSLHHVTLHKFSTHTVIIYLSTVNLLLHQ